MKTRISAEEWQKVEQEASVAKTFLESKKFQFIRDYILLAAEDIERKILNNLITEVREETTITDRLKRVFITPKKVQIDELSGVYKWITKFMNDMEEFAKLPEVYLEAQEKKKIIIEIENEK